MGARGVGVFAIGYVVTKRGKRQAPAPTWRMCWSRRAALRWCERANAKPANPRTEYVVLRMPEWLLEIEQREEAYQQDLSERAQASRDRQFAAHREWQQQIAEGLA